MTVKDYIFLQTSYMQLKYSNINCAEWWIPAKKVPDLNCEVRYVFVIRGSGSQTRGAGSKIGRIPPQSNPCTDEDICRDRRGHIVSPRDNLFRSVHFMRCQKRVEMDGQTRIITLLHTAQYLEGGGRWGAIAPRKRARKIFVNVSQNKSSDRKLCLIPFVLFAYRVE